MRLSFCVEDDLDEFVVSRLVEAVSGEAVEACGKTALRTRRGGAANALRLAAAFARDAYNKGCDGAVFVIDNDGAPQHRTEHDEATEPECRLCLLRRAAAVAEVLSWPRPEAAPLVFAFGVAVQTIEAWLLHARGHDFKGEENTLGSDAPGRRRLKRLLTGLEDPDSATLTNAAAAALDHLDVAALAARSPSFADFKQQVEAWPRAPGP